jgi:hypothetical protein
MTGPMIESTKAAAAATTGGTPSAARTAAVHSAKSFASVLAKSSADTGSSAAKTTTTTATATAKAEARPDGEQTTKVAGHPYSRIVNGDDKGLYLNQVAGNPRMGRAFKLVERDDHVFHIYGTGKDRVIIGLPQKSADATTATKS